MKRHNWKIVDQNITKASRILLTTHVNPDGDGLGAEAAFYYLLKKLGKEPEIWNHSELPLEYQFLNEERIYNQINLATPKEYFRKFDLVISVDVGGYDRLGLVGKIIEELKIPLVCIDHHPHCSFDTEAKVVEEQAAATACLVYEYFKLNYKNLIDSRIATALFTGLITDTGSFRFDNTTSEAFKIASELVKYDIKPSVIYAQIYENYRPEKLRLLGFVLQNINFELGNRLAWFTLTNSQIAAVGAIPDEVDGFTEFIRSVRDVEIAIMFLEVNEKRTRINLRSKGNVFVNGIARLFGGGGHPNAAGIVLNVGLQEAVEAVLPEVRSFLMKNPKLGA